ENYVTMPVASSIALPHVAELGHGRYAWGRGDSLKMTVVAGGTPKPPTAHSEAAFIIDHYWGYTRQRDGSTLEYRVEHPRWNVWETASAEFHGDATTLYGGAFAQALCETPCSAFLVDGSKVTVRHGVRVESESDAPRAEALQFQY